MKYLYIWLAGLFLLACTAQETEKLRDIRLWYDAPAANWNEALPLGNGRLGAMVFGDPQKEHLQLNENTLYSGEPSTTFTDVRITPEMKERVIRLLKNGAYKQASDLVCKHWLGRLHQYYQPLGDLYLTDHREGEVYPLSTGTCLIGCD